MTEITVLHNQTLFDIAIQYYGTALMVFALALANDISPDVELVPGQKLKLPVATFNEPDIVQYFAGKGQKIATGYTGTEEPITEDYSFPYGFPLGF